MRYKGLKGLEGFLRQGDEGKEGSSIVTKARRRGLNFIKSGLRKYVRIRQTIVKIKYRRDRKKERSRQRPPYFRRPSTGLPSYRPWNFRHKHPYTPCLHQSQSCQSTPQDDVLESPGEASELETWMMELWHDFLIEPTPYLVASAMVYLGAIVIFIQYYLLIWRIICFSFKFIPGWDEEFWSDGRF